MNQSINQPFVVTVGVDALKDGMILAEDLRHFNGRLILKKSTQLGPKELRIIKMWGITEARVQKSAYPDDKNQLEKKAASWDEKAQELATQLFQFSDLDHEVNRELHRLFLKRFSPAMIKEQTSIQDENKVYSITPVNAAERIREDIALPSLPDIVIRINEAVNSPNCTATHIANIINKDSSLTAKLLQLVNSAFYNFPTSIESIPRAVTIIGSRQLSTIAMATAVTSTFKDIPPEIIDMKSFWKHSLACGIICRLIAGYRKSGDLDTESCFLAGLLHDIGRLIIYQYFPQEAKALLHRSRLDSRILLQVEPNILMHTHSELGSILIEKWSLPVNLLDGCLYHHEPMDSPNRIVASITHVADIIVNALQMGSSGERFVPPLNPEAWQLIGLPVSVIAPIVQQTASILKETIHTYLDNVDDDNAEF